MQLFKRASVIVATLVLASTLAPLTAQSAAAQPVERQCSDSSEPSTIRLPTCINGTDNVPSRGPGTFARVPMSLCLGQVSRSLHPAAIFDRKTCSTGTYIQAERIAQARFVQWLDLQDRSDFIDLPGGMPDDPDEVGIIGIHPATPAFRTLVLEFDGYDEASAGTATPEGGAFFGRVIAATGGAITGLFLDVETS